MTTLTKRQKETLDFVSKYIKKNGYAPSLEEVANFFDKSIVTIHEHIETLISKGFLKKDEHKARGIEIVDKENMVTIPLLGTIAAGQPIEALEEKETIVLPKSRLMNGGNFFALKVAGDSMIEENINNGDIVVVKNQPTAENGQKVIALINNYEVTLKKLYREKNRIRLQPANPKMDPIFVKPDNLVIQGVVTDIIKQAFSQKIQASEKPPIKYKINEWTNTIQCIDCVEGMKQIPDDSIDLILTDPPYGISRDLNCKNQRLGTTAKLNFNFGEWDKFNKEWFGVAVKKTKGWIITFCAKKDIGFYWDILEKNDFKAIDVLVWQKPDPVPLNAKTKFLNAWESAVIAKKAGATFNGKCKHNILKYQAPKGKNRIHPTQKPEELLKELILLTTKKDDLVLDPFIGSGTTAVASLNTGRKYIGFEIDKGYYQKAQTRVQNVQISLI